MDPAGTPRPFTTLSGPSVDQQQSAFFKLAAELRNRIYYMAFNDYQVHIKPHRHRGELKIPGYSPQGRSKPPPLLVTCKQAYHEAIKIFYAEASFVNSGYRKDVIINWIKNIGSHRRSLISDIRIPCNVDVLCWSTRKGHVLQRGEHAAFILYFTADELKGLANILLGEGVLKTSLYSHENTVWTAKPMQLANDMVLAGKWLRKKGWMEDMTFEGKQELLEMAREEYPNDDLQVFLVDMESCEWLVEMTSDVFA